MATHSPEGPIKERGSPDTIVVEDEVLRAGFTQIPNVLLRREDISPGAKLAYMVLLSYAWQTDSCFPGHDRLAADLGVAKRSVVTYMQQLTNKGLIVVERRGLGQTNVYRLLRLSGSAPDSRSEKSALLEVQKPSLLEVQNLPPNKDSVEEDTNENPSKVRKVQTTQEIGDQTETHQNTPSRSGSLDDQRRSHNQTVDPSEQHQAALRPSPRRQGNGRTSSDRPESSRTGFSSVAAVLDGNAPKGASTGHVRPQKAYPDDRQIILGYIRDFAIELGDEAPLPSSVSRAYNLYERTGIPMARFIAYLYEARSLTQEYTASVKKKRQGKDGPFGPGKNKMPYFFSILEELVTGQHGKGSSSRPPSPA